MKKLVYYIFASIWFLFSLLPFRVLYFISDLLYYPLYYVIRYRRKVVRKNLVKSFPEKDLKEIIEIEKGFYSFFCDYIVETLKLFTMSEKNIRKRMTFGGIGEMERVMGTDKSCLTYLGHYCNWEWISSLQLHVSKGVHCGQIYHKLRNKAFDALFLKLRGRFGSESISMSDTLRRIITLRNEGTQFVIGFISDQVPQWKSIRHWVDFLHQDTPVFHGTERIARQTKSVVFYAEVKRVKRGYYHCEFQLMHESPQELSEYALTDMYFKRLEETIRREPRYWLWTHNRWKRQRNK